MKLPANINRYHGNGTLLLQFILNEYFKVSKELSKNLAVEKVIHTLAGSTLASMRLFSWTLDDSPVAKLKTYCAYLHHEENFPKRGRDALKKLTFTLWELGLEAVELIDEKKSPKALMREMEKISEAIAKELKKLVTHLSKDENILYYILRHYNQVDAVFGQDFVKGVLKRKEKNLLEGYKRRNFTALVTNIEEKLSQL